MHRVGFAFTDCVTGKHVFYWLDGFDRVWMAESAWAWFRVRADREGGE